MKNPWIAAALLAAVTLANADEEWFREKFADPATRAEALTALVPGTTRWYFHQALHHQLAGRDAQFRQVIEEWKTAADRPESNVSDKGLEMLENRQLLLNHGDAPRETAEELARKLGMEFTDERPDAVAANRKLPTRVDPEWINEQAFEKAAAQDEPDAPYQNYEGTRLLRELSRIEEFDDDKVRWFLQHLKRADLPGVVPLVDRGLSMSRPVSFGNELHRLLLEDQLRALLELHPELRSSRKFCLALLAKMRPGALVDFRRDRAAHAAYLAECKDFAITLPPAMGNLKAHILFHHLRMQRDLGNLPKRDFLEYLTAAGRRSKDTTLPKPVVDPGFLNADFAEVTGCPPIGSDREIVDAYLDHFLAVSDERDDFTPFFEADELRTIQARARLMAGGDVSKWGVWLEPTDFRDLQETSWLDFAPGAPDLLGADDEVSLTLDLKNTPELLVRIFELDATHGREADVGVDLGGLFPHHERTLRFAQAPIILHRETIDLPELAGPGRWVVEFVSAGQSARALVRKGVITPVVEREAGAQIVRVFDEAGKPVMDAEVRLGREVLKADESGAIRVPDTPHQAPRSGVVAAGKLVVPLHLGSRTDEPELDVGFHLEREQLLADLKTTLPFRVRLTNHGREIPLDRLKNPALVLQARLAGDTTTERIIAEDLKLDSAMEIPFQVPADLRKITVTLRGSYTPETGGEPVKLQDSATYQINEAADKPGIGALFFSPVAGGYRLEARGRNGEPLPSRALNLEFYRDDYDEPVLVEVRTDEDGRVDLGPLDGIYYLNASGGGLEEMLCDLSLRTMWTAANLSVPEGREVRIPMAEPMETPDHARVSLLETIDGKPLRDHFDKVAIDGRHFVIRGLEAGDYEFRQEDDTTRITIAAGETQGGWIVSPLRISPLHEPAQPVVAEAGVDGKSLRVRLLGSDAETRVSVVGRRYRFANWDPGSGLEVFQPERPRPWTTGYRMCSYRTGERLSDETRYILDRRAARVFPGSMLPRPGRLIYRWSEEDADQVSYETDSGSGGESSRGDGTFGTVSEEASDKRDHDKRTSTPEACDFLAFPAAIRFDLKPAADGTLEIPMEHFEGCQFLEVIASAPFASDTKVVALPASDTPRRDRRIARPFDPKSHHVATRAAAVLEKGATATIENLLDADWRAFTTLADVHQFLYGQTADERMRDFVFLTEWPDLTEERKLELLETHHCHELHLFLARKDPEFFERHVKPFLAAKPEPTFLDDYLLGRDLAPYLRPFAWSRLNAAEKALLARALPDSRETIARELSLRWENESPPPEEEARLFAQVLRGSDLSLTDTLGMARRELRQQAADADRMAYMTEKLKRIIIPRIDFKDTTVEEAVDFLLMRAKELDTLELDPSSRGVNINLRHPRGEELKIRKLQVENVPLGQALKYIADATKLRIKNDGDSIQLVPQTETGEDLFTRVFDVPPDFAASMDSSGGSASGDPFAEPSPSSGSVLKARVPIGELLKRAGVNFPEGSSATLSANGKLLVTSNAMELDKVEQLTQTLGAGPSDGIPSARGFAGTGRVPTEEEDLQELPNSVGMDPFAAPAAGHYMELDMGVLPTFPERTRVWHEANYLRWLGSTGESFIPLNRFWLDLSAWDGEGGFRSAHFNECANNANEALMCLALLDLPFHAERPEVNTEGSTLRVKAREPMLLFYKDTRRTEDVAAESPLLVRQTYLPSGEPYRTVEGRQVENAVTGDFQPGNAYTCLLVVTNPTGIGRRIDLLAQIPAGAIPLAGHPATLSVTKDIEPHGVVMEELAFYFPAPGDFAVYPLHVSENGKVLAHTAPRTLRVSTDPDKADDRTWAAVALDGTDDEVLARLRTENLANVDLSLIQWRLKDRALFRKVSEILRKRLAFHPGVFAYGFHHNDVRTMRDYLENSEAVTQLGSWLDSPLLEIRPTVHLDWRTIEFDPLVNPRAHDLADHPRMTHEFAHERYLEFLEQLGWKPKLDSADQFSWAALLLLQDRIEEALARFDLVDPAELPSTLPYDYMHCVVLFLREQAAEARGIAAKRLESLPPGLWSERFESVVSQADEITAANKPDGSGPGKAAAEAPRLEIEPAGEDRIAIRHSGIGEAKLRLFPVDLEMLFSKNPFLESGAGASLPSIRPNETLDVPLPAATGETEISLPESLRKGNLLVSAEAGDLKLLRVLESRSLDLRNDPAERTVQVFSRASSRPLPKAYVKVYAERAGGEVSFHKDGYTDLRGKFDYLSHTGESPAGIRRLAVLVSHPDFGARTVIYDR
ncbi:MAG: hypothetical protein H7A48_13355 [Akkermansiaceae bacterium]|nr:hypothetical protein [Akkermansiaceae bacterium]